MLRRGVRVRWRSRVDELVLHAAAAVAATTVAATAVAAAAVAARAIAAAAVAAAFSATAPAASAAPAASVCRDRRRLPDDGGSGDRVHRRGDRACRCALLSRGRQLRRVHLRWERAVCDGD